MADEVNMIDPAKNRAVLEEMGADLPAAGGMTGAELDELRDACRAQYTENIARKSGIAL
jgi:hypothetical protein